VKSVAVIGLAYGDEAKGTVTARICATEEIAAVIRFSGGCQAAHNVVTDDGRHHTFAQFGSGTFSDVPTFLSRYMMVEPFALLREADHLEAIGVSDPLRLVSIDPRALMTTPYHGELNRWLEESRGQGRHGTTARGIGTTAEYAAERPESAPQVLDLMMLSSLSEKLSALREWVLGRGVPAEFLPEVDTLVERYREIREQINIVGFDYIEELLQDRCVFEGSQGVLLDEDYGFFPYVTRSHTTDDNVWKLIKEAGAEDPEIIGVTRAYTTRHGFGPFPSENPSLNFPEEHNKYEYWMGSWRSGHLDIVALRYAIDVCKKIDGIYVTHLDTVKNETNAGYCLYYIIQDESELIINLPIVDPFDFAARAFRSERLYAQNITPIVFRWGNQDPTERLSTMLSLPIVGRGAGPKISDGTGIKLDKASVVG
jgi:adenylosuccinate synthase